MNLPKSYEAAQYESNIYQLWEEGGYFNPDNLPGPDTYSIMMPPPNVTGVLHLGHALENSLMDIQARYQRMLGKKVVLIPGTDHAAVATQARVEDNLKQAGMDNPRQELGREGLLEKIREYAEDSKATILNQVRKMGTSADWSRLAYTFDETRSAAVNAAFLRMYEDGLIYRGYRVVNWSVVGQSTASDDELEYKERTTTLYTFKYAKDFPIPVATVLPETKLGDSAVAVHPDDDRYNQYIGQTFTVDVGAAAPLEITVIADEHVDPEYGTGALGVTPAHSQTDFEMYQKNPQIGLIQVVGKDGCMTAATGEQYAGLPVKEARAKFVQYLRDNDLMISESDITHNVSLSDRFKDEIWPMPMDQWFVNVNAEIPTGAAKGKTLKQLMSEAVTTGHNGDAAETVTITPQRFQKIYTHWIDNLHDWCISRQIWWGHRIPVWYRDSGVGENTTGERQIEASVESPAGEGWYQDEDTLDTWFSSGMWTFSTLGWPEQTEDFANFHSSNWMQMGHEILFLWMARMILFSTYLVDTIPFKDVYIHGILRDKDGKKFSKSSGNGIDPLDVIASHGTDALRLSLIKGISPGNDARYYEEKVDDARNFVNKLWNISRFVFMQEESATAGVQEVVVESLADKWIVARLNHVITATTEQMNNYQFSQATETLYNFVWHEFADWYVELAKVNPNPGLARSVLQTSLRLLHPVVPFVTEAIWLELNNETPLIVSEWPDQLRQGYDGQVVEVEFDEVADRRFMNLKDMITQFRNLRTQYKIPYSNNFVVHSSEALTTNDKEIIEKMCKVTVEEGVANGNITELTNSSYSFTISLGELIDTEAEQQRLQKEIAKLEGTIKGFKAKLANTGYTDNAPAAVVEETHAKLAEQQDQLVALQATLQQFAN